MPLGPTDRGGFGVGSICGQCCGEAQIERSMPKGPPWLATLGEGWTVGLLVTRTTSLKKHLLLAVSVAVLSMVSLGMAQTAGAISTGSGRADSGASLSGTPSMTVKPSANLVGNRVVHIKGKNWSTSNGGVNLYLCSPEPPNGARCGIIGFSATMPNGSWSMDYIPMNPRAPVSCNLVCYIEADEGSTVLTSMLTFKPLSVFFTPVEGSEGYYWTQKVAVHVTGFPAGDRVTVEICISGGACDPDTSATIMTNTGGSGSLHPYFLNLGICAMGGGECSIFATDPSFFGGAEAFFDFQAFCGPICGGFGPIRK